MADFYFYSLHHKFCYLSAGRAVKFLFFIIPVFFLIYLMPPVFCFGQENRLRCARAALIYEGVLVCSEAITLTLLLLSDTELHQVSMGIQYHPFYYIFEYILMFFVIFVLYL